MRAILQRVTKASVTIDSNINAEIGKGLLILLGVGNEDTQDDIVWLSNKISNIRVFSDAEGKMNLSLKDIDGDAIVVSQFTLFASTKKGNRPSYLNSAKPEQAIPLYEAFVKQLETDLGKPVGTGVFGADMQVELCNDGPVTISIDTKDKE